MSRCDLTELPADQCAHCLGHGKTPAAGLTIEREFLAQFPGRCACCDSGFRAGDYIGRTTDSEYVCPTCVEASR